MRLRVTLGVLLCFTVPILKAADLTWTGTQSSEWNTLHTNWAGGQVFQTGDSVAFSNAQVFIGLDGSLHPVAPRGIVTRERVIVSGGDILTGGITNYGGNLIFSNYSNSLSFPGDIRIQNLYSGLSYDVRNAPHDAQLRLGSGRIILTDSSWFIMRVGTDKTATLLNDFLMESGGVTFSPYGEETNGTVRLTGKIFLNGQFNVDCSGLPRARPDELAGGIELWQAASRTLRMNISGGYGRRALQISGPITDGPGSAQNRLEFVNYGHFAFRLTGNNTYRNGTFIRPSPSAPGAPIEVGLNSSLGNGDVEVQGPLRLMGSRNLATNASLRVPFQNYERPLTLDTGVKIRLRALQLGTNNYTTGRFTSNNAPAFIAGDGELRLPSTNLPPHLELKYVPSVAYAGSHITVEAMPSDIDGRIARVDFLINEIYMAGLTNPPWRFTFEASAPYMSLTVGAFDDENAYDITGAVIRVTDPPALPVIENVRLAGSSQIAFEFTALADVQYRVQHASSLTSSTWTDLQMLPVFAAPTRYRLTNSVPTNVRNRFYRVHVEPVQ